MNELSLSELGWNEVWNEELSKLEREGLQPMRVAQASRGQLRLLGMGEPVSATLRGRFKDPVAEGSEVPVVGDWVAADLSSGSAVVEHVLKRISCFVRKSAGKSSKPQVLAANLDRIFIVTACGRDFNPRRIERYLAAVWSSGAEPVVVVNKTDLPHDRIAMMEELNSVALGVETAMVNTRDEDGLDKLTPLLESGMTIALVGSSGVGKSTIINILLGDDRQATQETREGDQKGRHTTSAQELFVTRNGLILIDTPGMRELGLFDAESGMEQTFSDISELADGCRFRDCSHTSETGCAVLAAVEDGVLELERLESYQRQRREIAHNERRAGENSKKRWKWIESVKRERKKIHDKAGLK